MKNVNEKIIFNFNNFIELDVEEIKLVWKWRNHVSIRKWMYDKEIIEFEKHLNFIKSLKNKKDKIYWLIHRNNTPVGVCSINNIVGKEGEWGYYIAPDYHEKNLGVEFYYYSLLHIFDKLRFHKIYGYNLVLNRGADSLNNLFGFSKSLVNRVNKDGIEENYYFRELYQTKWNSEIKNCNKIDRLLLLTKDKLKL